MRHWRLHRWQYAGIALSVKIHKIPSNWSSCFSVNDGCAFLSCVSIAIMILIGSQLVVRLMLGATDILLAFYSFPNLCSWYLLHTMASRYFHTVAVNAWNGVHSVLVTGIRWVFIAKSSGARRWTGSRRWRYNQDYARHIYATVS